MLSFVCTRIGEQDDLLLPRRATSSFTTVAGQGWLAGRKASLDCVIKAGASRRLMSLAALIAPGVATGEQSPPRYSHGRGFDRQPFWGQCAASICS
jgi:hypothetical protein